MNRAEILATLENKSSKAMQTYASSCLRNYCELKKISHPAITKLLEHLDSMPTTSNLSEWDAQGAQLDLNGRGDPIPQNIKSNLSSNDLDEFSILVDSVVEVGIVDLYGAQTGLPLILLDKAMQILDQNAISLPALTK
ncbi:hypothetical protein ACI2OW_23000 [Pseudomonas shirazica]|uniref:hypothetical protein n=1 Tax=Pseudomonas TaxID=286 RepID=UPI003851E59A